MVNWQYLIKYYNGSFGILLVVINLIVGFVFAFIAGRLFHKYIRGTNRMIIPCKITCFLLGFLGLQILDSIPVIQTSVGVLAGNSKSELLMGIYLSRGYGIISYRPDLAILYFKRSAERGNTKSMLCLYKIYKNGIGTGKDIHLAEYWRQTAVKHGDKNANNI